MPLHVWSANIVYRLKNRNMKQLPFRCKKSAAGTTPDVCYFRALHKAQIITLTLLPVHTHIPHCTEIEVLSASQSIAFIVQKNVGCVSSLQQPRSSILTGSEHILTTVRSTVRFIIWCQVNVHKLCYACEMWTGGNCWKVQLRVVWESWNKAVSTCRNIHILWTWMQHFWSQAEDMTESCHTTTFPPSPEINTCRWDRGG